MTVGLMVITHGDIGASLLDTATTMLDVCPLKTEVVCVGNDCDPDSTLGNAKELAKSLNDGDGVLVLTDVYGSTPSNIACQLQTDGHVHIVSGVNLPMLIRILNYPRLSLDELTHKAVTGGKDGVMLCKRDIGS